MKSIKENQIELILIIYLTQSPYSTSAHERESERERERENAMIATQSLSSAPPKPSVTKCIMSS